MSVEGKLIETPYYSPWVSARNRKFGFQPKRIPLERASQEEQSGANFSSVAPSSEELCMYRRRGKLARNALLYIVHGFRPELENARGA